MPDDEMPTELNRVTAEKRREEAEDLREEAVYVSRPQAVASLIEQAAKSAALATR